MPPLADEPTTPGSVSPLGPRTGSGAGDRPTWLDEVEGEDALAWVKNLNAATQDRLDGQVYGSLYRQLLAMLNDDKQLAIPVRRGAYLYNTWRDERNPRGLWRRTTLESLRSDKTEWELLLDIDELSAEEDTNWVFTGVSYAPDYSRALLSLSRGGADAAEIREFDLVDPGFIQPDEGGFFIPEAKSDVLYLDTDTVIVGSDFGHETLTDSGYPRTLRRWSRGMDLYDRAASPEVFAGETTDVAVSADVTVGDPDRTVVFSRAVDFFHRQIVLPDPATGYTTHVPLDVPDDATVLFNREWMFLLIRSEAEFAGDRYAAGSLLVANTAAWQAGATAVTPVFCPTEHSSLEALNFTRSHLVLTVLVDVATELQVIPLAGDPTTWQAVPVTGLPENSTTSIISTYPEGSEEVLLRTSGFLTPPQMGFMELDAAGHSEAAIDVLAAEIPRFDTRGMSVVQHWATSADGTQIPYFLVGMGVDTDTPEPTATQLWAYGGFEVSIRPNYIATAGISWLSRGGNFVIANLRGGGEFGPTWHTQATGNQRWRVFEDLAAVADDLVARGHTTHKLLSFRGGSNGGLLAGVAATQLSERFGAVVSQVPLLDMLRYHELPPGASWIAEYGDPRIPEEAAYIATYSPMQNIPAASERALPALLLTTSTRDDRVHPAHARQFVHRLTELGHPVDYFENTEGGHGGAADNSQVAHLWALVSAWLWQHSPSTGSDED